MSHIENTLGGLRARGEKALITFLTAGDPDLETSERLIHTLVESGADLIELGMPFSDPMADGPTIQASSERALAAGTTLHDILEMVRRVREHTNTPILLMGYYNPVYCYGTERFARDAADVGIDGLLLVDLPPEEAGELQPALRAAGIDLITLLAPTTEGLRMTRLAEAAEGFLYFVSMTGVTGSQQVDAASIQNVVAGLQANSRVPVAVGFGVTTPGEAREIAGFADAVVVGSALVKIIAEHGRSETLLKEVGLFVRALKEGVRSAARFGTGRSGRRNV